MEKGWKRTETGQGSGPVRVGLFAMNFFLLFFLSAFFTSTFSMSQSFGSKSSSSKSWWREGSGGGVEFCCWDYVLLPNSIDLGIFHGYQSSIVALYSVVQRHTSTTTP